MDVIELEGGNDWKMRAADRDGWKAGCILGWPLTPKKKKKYIYIRYLFVYIYIQK
jgi:hypothetical protein